MNSGLHFSKVENFLDTKKDTAAIQPSFPYKRLFYEAIPTSGFPYIVRTNESRTFKMARQTRSIQTTDKMMESATALSSLIPCKALDKRFPAHCSHRVYR